MAEANIESLSENFNDLTGQISSNFDTLKDLGSNIQEKLKDVYPSDD